MFKINGGRVLRRGLLKKLKALINIVFVFLYAVKFMDLHFLFAVHSDLLHAL